MELMGYFASILMGLSLGMMGGGGSILTIPILVYLFKIEPVMATGYSLFIVGVTALLGGFWNLRNGSVDIKTGMSYALPSFLGVYLTRTIWLPALPDPVFQFAAKTGSNAGVITMTKPLFLMLFFSVLMLLASASMIYRARKSSAVGAVGEIETVDKKKPLSVIHILLIALTGFGVGSVMGFVGAGGGFLIIPALVLLVGMPMRVAVGTSLFIIAANSLIGFVGDLQQHSTALDWPLLGTVSAIAVIGLFLGAHFSRRVSDSALKKGFGYFVLAMGAFVLADQLKNLF